MFGQLDLDDVAGFIDPDRDRLPQRLGCEIPPRPWHRRQVHEGIASNHEHVGYACVVRSSGDAHLASAHRHGDLFGGPFESRNLAARRDDGQHVVASWHLGDAVGDGDPMPIGLETRVEHRLPEAVLHGEAVKPPTQWTTEENEDQQAERSPDHELESHPVARPHLAERADVPEAHRDAVEHRDASQDVSEVADRPGSPDASKRLESPSGPGCGYAVGHREPALDEVAPTTSIFSAR